MTLPDLRLVPRPPEPTPPRDPPRYSIRGSGSCVDVIARDELFVSGRIVGTFASMGEARDYLLRLRESGAVVTEPESP